LCGQSDVKNGDRIVAQNHHRQPSVQEGFLAVVISENNNTNIVLLLLLSMSLFTLVSYCIILLFSYLATQPQVWNNTQCLCQTYRSWFSTATTKTFI